jgi:hypothetical protein
MNMAKKACPVTLQFASRSQFESVSSELTVEAKNWAPKGVKLWTGPSSILSADPGLAMTLFVGVASGVATKILADMAKAVLLRMWRGLAASQLPAIAPTVTVRIGSVNVHLNQETTELHIANKAQELAAELARQLGEEEK